MVHSRDGGASRRCRGPARPARRALAPVRLVWDFYVQGVAHVAETGEFPETGHCWVCGHPPLFFALGSPLYAFGHWLSPGTTEMAQRWLGALALASAALTTWYAYRLLRLFRCRRGTLLAGTAIALAFPCLFISAYAPEADILLTAILAGLIFHLTRDFAQHRHLTLRNAVWTGTLAGLAIATKYSGLLAPVSIGVMTVVELWRASDRTRVARYGAIALACCVAVGGWAYARNLKVYGQLFPTNGSSQQGLSLEGDRLAGRYTFTTFRLGDVETLLGPDAPVGELTTFSVYRSVPTTLHALAWSDMSFFSVKSRHGDRSKPYENKSIPPTLTMAVLILGVLADGLALFGAIVSFRRRSMRPLVVISLLTMAAYAWWFLPQQEWALKTKYVLFLVLPYLVFIVSALGWLWRRVPVLGLMAAVGLIGLVAVSHVYDYAFAYGRL